jgi:hypothetical protein
MNWGWVRMRKSLVPALLTASLPHWVGAKEIPVEVYEVLESHPACSGVGKIAYRVTFDALLDRAEYFSFADFDQALDCQITERRGTDQSDRKIPCDGVKEAHRIEEVRLRDFCHKAPERPELNLRIEGALVGCLSTQGNEFLEGKWKLTGLDGLEPASASGSFDDERFRGSYLLPQGTRAEAMPRLYLGLMIDGLRQPSVPDETLGVAASVTMRLLEQSEASACGPDLGKCLDQKLQAASVPDEPPQPKAMICNPIYYYGDGTERPVSIDFSDVLEPWEY